MPARTQGEIDAALRAEGGPARDELTRDELVIPVLQETARIGKRQVESGRVRIHKTVSERDETVEVLLKRQDLDVERVPVGRVVEEAPAPREEDGVLIVPVLEEVLVIEKRLMLKEELRIRRRNTEQTVHETVRLRTEAVSVEHIPAPAAPTASPEPTRRSEP